MKLVAIVGMCGSGKSELTKLFEEQGYKKIRFGDVTDEVLKKKGLELTEVNEKLAREALRKEYGMEAYAKLNLRKIQESFLNHNVIIDGLYSLEEYEFLKEKFPDMVVLAVYSPPILRYQRLEDREIRPLTREQAIKRDKMEIENLHKAGPIAMADYTILNAGELFDIKQNFDEFIEWMHENET